MIQTNTNQEAKLHNGQKTKPRQESRDRNKPNSTRSRKGFSTKTCGHQSGCKIGKSGDVQKTLQTENLRGRDR